MNEYVVIAIVSTAVFVLALVRLSLKTFVKTSVQESIKHEFEVQRQQMREEFERQQNELESKDKFRLAALDKRMEIHQRAFALGQEMLPLVHAQTEKKISLLQKCEEFWNTSALYLTEEAREAFSLAKHYFGSYDIVHMVWKIDKREEHRADLEKAFSAIRDLPQKLIAITDKESSGRTIYIKGDNTIDAFGPKSKSSKVK